MNQLASFEELFKEIPSLERLQRLVDVVQEIFQCGAVALLKLEGNALSPIATKDLVSEASERKFNINQHPCFNALINSPSAQSFPINSPLPKPFEGLLIHQAGTAVAAQDCMGIKLNLQDKCWGLLTLYSRHPDTFDAEALSQLERYRVVIEAIIRLSIIEDAEAALLSYPWPGSISELEHAIGRAAIKALNVGFNTQEGFIVDNNPSKPAIPNQFPAPLSSVSNSQDLLEKVQGMSMKDAVRVFQKDLILKELQQQSGSWSATARAFKLDPSNLHKLAVKLGIK